MASNILDSLLNEFYYPTTPNERKRQIEIELISYKNHPNSWQQSLCGLQQQYQENQFLWFFNTSTIEHTITKRWYTLKPQDRATIRDTLWAIYANLSSTSSIPKRQRDTIAQLLTLMGKRDFPDDHPDYMNNIKELIKKDCILGIVLLRSTSEEIVSTRDDVSTDRKKYFQSCVSLCLSDIMNIFESILHVSVCDLNQQHSSLPNDNHRIKILLELLPCIQHLFSWISLDLVSDGFLISIFELARWRENSSDEISVGALLILNELFYIQRSVPLPDTLIKGVKELLLQKNLEKSSDLYQDKFTELLRLYTNKYWHKLITDNDTFRNVIIELYQYTFSGYGALAFTEKLEVWTPIIKGLTTTTSHTTNDNMKYADIMNSLCSGILKKMQFHYDPEQELDILDNETLDDNMETEWQHYLTQCIETIVLIAERHPLTVFEQIYNDWQRSFEMCMAVEKYLSLNDARTFLFEEHTKCHFIHRLLRDLSSLCQTIIRLIGILCEKFSTQSQQELQILSTSPSSLLYVERISNIKQCLTYLIKFLGLNQFQRVENSNILKANISELHSQVLLALRDLIGNSFISISDTDLKELIEEVGKILLPSSSPKESNIVTLSAAQLLLKISTVIRPKFMIECNSILQLMQAGSNLSAYLTKQVIAVIYQMIVSCLVYPWSNVNRQNQDFDRRNVVLQDYIACLATDFLRIDNIIASGDNQNVKVCVITTSILPILKEVIDYFRESNSQVKQMLTNSMKDIITKSLSVYQCYGLKYNEISESVSDFALSVLRCLQIQLGSMFIQEMIRIFIESLSREQLNNNRLKAMEKILHMLILIVEQPGSSSMALLPSILGLALNQALPWLKDDKNSSNDSDAVYLLFSLFDKILLHRWQYFYKSQVLRGFSPGASDAITPSDELLQHADQLSAILTAYGYVLVNGTDPHLNRIILISLQTVNDKWKLYSRDFFKDNLLYSFQYALINALFSAEGAIYYDLLLNILFSMGQVNITKLHDAFLSSLGNGNNVTIAGNGCNPNRLIIDDICLATDLPTFSQKVTQLIQDTRCMRLSSVE